MFGRKKAVDREEIEVLRARHNVAQGVLDGRSHHIRKRDLCSSESARKCEKKTNGIGACFLS